MSIETEKHPFDNKSDDIKKDIDEKQSRIEKLGKKIFGKKKAEEENKKSEDGSDDKTSEETKDEVKPMPLNDTNPLWLKSPKDCTDEEYIKFYQQVFNVFDEPFLPQGIYGLQGAIVLDSSEHGLSI